MAAGDTQVSICNKALMFLGAEAITSFTDGSVASDAGSSMYTELTRTTLAMYPWSFTLAKTQLARDTATPANEWTYQYIIPPDTLLGVPRAVRSSSA